MLKQTKETVLEVKDLHVSFKTLNGMVRAVRGVDFSLTKGETLALVGESGSGKSVSTKTIMGILSNNAVINSGQILYEGMDLTKVVEDDFHQIRGHKIGLIFQDPLSSLNPIMKIGKQITEGLILNGKRLKNQEKSFYKEEEIAYRSVVSKIKSRKIQLKRAKENIKEGMKIKFNFFKNQKEIEIAELKKEDAENKSKISDSNLNVENNKSKIAELRKEIKTFKKTGLLVIKAELVKEYEEAKDNYLTVVKEEKHKIPALKETLVAAKEAAKIKIKTILDEKTKEIDEKIEKTESKEEIAQLKEELRRFIRVTKSEAKEIAINSMKEVGIPQPEIRFNQYPFQFSGGMRQRIVIAIALTQNPDVLICDEPTTALDVTIQAQILDLINELKVKRNMSVIFITHDLGVVASMADRVAVMYCGKIVEKGTVEDIFYDPRHPYTWALLSSMPDLETKEKLAYIPGTPPNMLFPPVGDAFAERNKYALKIDFVKQPPMFKVSDTHEAATWLLHEDAPKMETPEIITSRIARMKNKIKEEA